MLIHKCSVFELSLYLHSILTCRIFMERKSNTMYLSRLPGPLQLFSDKYNLLVSFLASSIEKVFGDKLIASTKFCQCHAVLTVSHHELHMLYGCNFGSSIILCHVPALSFVCKHASQLFSLSLYYTILPNDILRKTKSIPFQATRIVVSRNKQAIM